jgi:hypothetical protein
VAHQLSGKAATVAQGLAPVPAGSSAHLARAITEGSHAAFMAGLHTTMLVAAFVALLGAALGPLVRSSGPGHVIAGEGGSLAPEAPAVA